jgi:hypothetical protein
MGLYERILRLEEPKIPVHAFMAAMAERKRGKVSAAQIVSTFALDAAAQIDAIALNARFDDTVNPLTGTELHDVLLLADAGLAYQTVTALKNRLGV